MQPLDGDPSREQASGEVDLQDLPAVVHPHSGLLEIGQDLWAVQGTVKIKPLFRFSRYMAVIRMPDKKSLALVNAVRLSDDGLAELARLGTVRHVVRLGKHHSMDDAFYVRKYDARMWAPASATHPNGVSTTNVLEDGADVPFAQGGKVFVFRTLKASEFEAALLLPGAAHGGGDALVTCDALQSHNVRDTHANLPTRAFMWLNGFTGKACVGPLWMKGVSDDKAALKTEFLRLLEAFPSFTALVSAHGLLHDLGGNARAEVEAAVQRAFK